VKALNLFDNPPSLLSDWHTRRKHNYYNLVLVINRPVVLDFHPPLHNASLTKFRRTNLSRARAACTRRRVLVPELLVKEREREVKSLLDLAVFSTRYVRDWNLPSERWIQVPSGNERRVGRSEEEEGATRLEVYRPGRG